MPRQGSPSNYQGNPARSGDGGGGGGATTFNQYTSFLEKIGPSSYATGGFIIDLSATYSSLNFFNVAVKKGTRGNVPFGRFRYLLDTPTAGKVTVVVEKYQQERVSSYDNITSQPAGVTIQTVAGQTSTSESSHTHTIDHDHASFGSGAPSVAGASVLLDATGPTGSLAHTHNLNLPALAGTSGTGTGHNHTDNTLYEHQHILTYISTNVTVTELPNTTNLSATTFLCMASGVRT